MTRALIYIHERRVIVVNIVIWNFLFVTDLSIKFLNFTEFFILPLYINM
jgi:hypothetical protein